MNRTTFQTISFYFLSALIYLVSLKSNAQNCIDLYAHTAEEGVTNEITYVSIDPEDGSFFSLLEISSPSDLFVEYGASAVNPEGQEFYFLETFELNTQLKVFSTVTGNLISSQIVDNSYYNLAYHCNDDLLIGLEQIANGSVQLVSVDPTTAVPIAISPFITIPSTFLLGLSTIDSTDDRYFFISQEADGTSILNIINTVSGATTSIELSFIPYSINFDIFSNSLIFTTVNHEIFRFDLTTNVENFLGNANITFLEGESGNTAYDPFEELLYISLQVSENSYKLFVVDLSDPALGVTSYPLAGSVTNLIAAIPCTAIPEFEYESACTGDETNFVDLSVGANSWSWDFGDSGSSDNFSSDQNPSHVYSSPGTYTVGLIIDGCVGQEGITQEITILDPPNLQLDENLSTCSSSLLLDAGSFPDATYFWSNGQNSQTINVTNSACYWVRVSIGNCVVQDTTCVIIQDIGSSSVDLGPDQSYCSLEPIILDTEIPGAEYIWSTGEVSQSITVSSTDTYSVTVTNGPCISEDEVSLTFLDGPSLDLGPDTVLACISDYPDGYELSAGISGTSFLWSTGSTSPNINALETGTYGLTVFNNDCQLVDEVLIELVDLQIDLGGNTNNEILACESNSYTLIPTIQIEGVIISDSNPQYNWSTGESTESITIDPSNGGIFELELRVADCILTESVEVIFSPEIILDLGEDETICFGDQKDLIPNVNGTSFNWSTGETTEQISVSNSGNYSLEVSNGGCTSTDDITISVQDNYSIELGLEQSLCPDNGESIVLDAGPGESEYLWLETGESSQTSTVFQGGLYNVETTDQFGCTHLGSILISELCSSVIIVPLAFSPNNDGQNDSFRAFGQFIESFKLNVFNRWGKNVYSSNDLNLGWDGLHEADLAPTGVYVWSIEYINSLGEAVSESGNVTLIR